MGVVHLQGLGVASFRSYVLVHHYSGVVPKTPSGRELRKRVEGAISGIGQYSGTARHVG